MKEEIQLLNLSKIYFYGKDGCKTDFARVCGYPEKNKEFRNWLDVLISNGILIEDGIGDRKNIILYKPHKGMILKIIKGMKNYEFLRKMFYDEYEGIFRF